jgi:hypothetical protein
MPLWPIGITRILEGADLLACRRPRFQNSQVKVRRRRSATSGRSRSIGVLPGGPAKTDARVAYHASRDYGRQPASDPIGCSRSMTKLLPIDIILPELLYDASLGLGMGLVNK